MAEMSTENGWRRFWNHGTWWKALILVAGYWVVFQLVSLGIALLFRPFIDAEDLLTSPSSIVFALALPILVSGLLLVALAWSLGWLGELFGRQPVRGRPWMWIAVALIVIPILMRLMATNWSAYAVTIVLSLLLFGLCVGFAEELLTRGFVIKMLRDGGHGERVVLILSSLYFAVLHAGNAITGQPATVVLFTVAYTFGFGALMYLSLRVTGRLVWVILLHAATDPTTTLATGGIDAHSTTTSGSDPLIALAGLFNVVYIAFALVAILFVKNRERSADHAGRSATIAG